MCRGALSAYCCLFRRLFQKYLVLDSNKTETVHQVYACAEAAGVRYRCSVCVPFHEKKFEHNCSLSMMEKILKRHVDRHTAVKLTTAVGLRLFKVDQDCVPCLGILISKISIQNF